MYLRRRSRTKNGIEYKSWALVETLSAISKETGKGIETIASEKGHLRQITMELLYRIGGMKGKEIAEVFGVNYTSVSQERGRLRDQLSKDRKLAALIKRIEQKCNG